MEEIKNSARISRTNSGFPDYLDFELLRKEGIDYLGKLSGKLWTDHNVHDPGITILEVLCYTLLDLGYRTNLPVKDLLTPGLDDANSDSNFFTPSEILTCNPLTITDFRKVLIDIAGVKNAWLEVATDQFDLCRRRDTTTASNEQNGSCVNYLNGLYHVYIDLEMDVAREFAGDQEAKQEYLDDITRRIKNVLMKYRNLCEDFVDIFILCKQEIGVCVDIVLEDSADVETVYLSAIETLRNFFSPSPSFYTLQQLLDKQKTIDEIFSGRPYNISESHGFVDTAELASLHLRKEIHLSDVYAVLLSIEGVKNVRDLRLQTCKNGVTTRVRGWKYSIPLNHVSDFSLSCSGFQFSRKGEQVPFDSKKFDSLFDINFNLNGKILYHSPSPYLDNEVPRGIYRHDLKDYQSIQNDFPRVYGISEGGLPEKVSPKRKAEAYQLKGYLLFFDQLLANYLAQLSSIRSLFAHSGESSQKRTYFINRLSSVPDLQKLLRFNGDDSSTNTLGTTGTILVIPVDRQVIISLKEQNKLETLVIDELQSYEFISRSDLDTAVHQLQNDLDSEQYQCEYITKRDECVYYYILSSSSHIALVSKKYFTTVREASEHLTSVKYIGTFEENYRNFVSATAKFSFHIELNLLAFPAYLERIVEDEALFQKRRQGFLSHLLSRFAEQFTDFALSTFKRYTESEIATQKINHAEKFLSSYDQLSSMRGKAYNYFKNGWNNDNVSGLEKRFNALSGIKNWKRHSLCNFVVDKYSVQYVVNLNIAGTNYFASSDRFDSREEALDVAREIFFALNDEANYVADLVPHDGTYRLKIRYAQEGIAVYPTNFKSQEEALSTAKHLSRQFSEQLPGSVFESEYVYLPVLEDLQGNVLRKFSEGFSTAEKAISSARKTMKRINDPKKWEHRSDDKRLGLLFSAEEKDDTLSFIDPDDFKIDIDNSILGKPNKYTYELLDHENNFKLQTEREFDDPVQAKEHAYSLLILLGSKDNYRISFEESSKRQRVEIISKDGVEAFCYAGKTSSDADERTIADIHSIVMRSQYVVKSIRIPHRWKFRYTLGYEKDNMYVFESNMEYPSIDLASKAVAEFRTEIISMDVEEKDNGFWIAPHGSLNSLLVRWKPENETGTTAKRKKSIEGLLEEHKAFRRLMNSRSTEAFSESVSVDDASEQGLYVYRVVDKDNVLAGYSKAYVNWNEASADLKHVVKTAKDVDYLQLCMGGDIIVEHRDAVTNVVGYRFQLLAVNYFYSSGERAGMPLVLLESAEHFLSRQAAQEAFIKYHLEIIHLASNVSSYGRAINFDGIPAGNMQQVSSTKTLAFVPKETQIEFGTTTDKVAEKLVEIFRKYPIRMVAHGSQSFYTLFPCEPESKNVGITDCSQEPETMVYYFEVSSGKADMGHWRSLTFYHSSEEATKDFQFFLILLRFTGNFFVDCDSCDSQNSSFKIFIREVLAESTRRFPTAEAAWGVEGLQKFICISQSEDAFHSYQKRDSCCYSFFLACGEGVVVHPCKYDSPEKRDDALNALYKSFRQYVDKGSWNYIEDKTGIVLKDANGEPFALMTGGQQAVRCKSDLILNLVGHASNDDKYRVVDGMIVLVGDDQEILIRAVRNDATLEDWKERIRKFLCYYPIVRSNVENETSKYCIEIRLPGFNRCEEKKVRSCGCGSEEADDSSPCYVSWKSRCCYTTCAEAEMALVGIYRLLSHHAFYRQTFDCECHSYGISLHTDTNMQANEISNIRSNNFTNEIVALNPQCYPSKEIACEAVRRAKSLINSEGLHLVEHILLRPRCPEDCSCELHLNPCDDRTHCRFIWKTVDSNPCSLEKDICFVPGEDPYSFIATVSLPAWSERFRSHANRRVFENILYRETPAHILLRIHWLAPHDFCCFEQSYKSWERKMAGKKACTDQFNACEFLELLFKRNYECVTDCEVCAPCDGPVVKENPCFQEITDRHDGDFLRQVNELFCWEPQHCYEYRFNPCVREKDARLTSADLLRAAGSSTMNSPLVNDDSLVTIDVPPRAEIANVSVDEVTNEKSTVEAAKFVKKRLQIFQKRQNKYHEMASQIVEKSKRNVVAMDVLSFVLEGQPSLSRVEGILDELLKQQPEVKGSKKLSKRQITDLIQTVMAHYLDEVCLHDQTNDMSALKDVMEKLKNNKVNLKALYSSWEPAKIKMYALGWDDTVIDNVFGKP